MKDIAIEALAKRAGITVEWTDYAGNPHRVTTDVLRRLLTALGLPCETVDDLGHSEQLVGAVASPPLVTATAGATVTLPLAGKSARRHAKVTLEDGTTIEAEARPISGGVEISAPAKAGYHTVEIGDAHLTLALAPARCLTIGDIAPSARLWGTVAQIYGLRHLGDCGIGDASAVIALAKQAAANDADAVALSPIHALFSADPKHFSPYSPSNRLFLNPLHADARLLFGESRVAKAMTDAGVVCMVQDAEQRAIIDWSRFAALKMAVFRKLFDQFSSTDLASETPLAADFAEFRITAGRPLDDHALFEALHSSKLRSDPAVWSWNDWPAPLRDCMSVEVNAFRQANAREILFQCFLQWIANRSFGAAQSGARQAGMRIGLIADLAVGMSGSGSQAWTSQGDVLLGLEIGAPPDRYNSRGQNWGLTTFSPRALSSGGFSPFIATLRACLRNAGGLRIDHAMGLLRLWVIPHGADPKEGAYLTYPIDDLLRLIALESQRHRAIIIGEDLGTVPVGFRERLAKAGVYGMRILWFERERDRYLLPQTWPTQTVAMTSTHDLPTVTGWWDGKDIGTRVELGLSDDPAKERRQRNQDRKALWQAFCNAKAAAGARPPEQESRIAAAAVKFVANTASDLALIPLEDVLSLEQQPNLPGTIDEYPNWRRRYPVQSEVLLDAPEVRERLAPLKRRNHP